MVDLKEEEFSTVDSQMRYQLVGNKLYIEIDMPSNLKNIAKEDNLSTSGTVSYTHLTLPTILLV